VVAARSGAIGSSPEGEPSRFFLTASYLTLFIGGAVLGIVGAFMLPRSAGSAFSAVAPADSGGAATHVLADGAQAGLGQLLSVGLLIAIVANPLLSFAGLRTAGTRLAAFTPLFGWLIVVLPMLYTTADGDEILPTGALRTIAFVLLGVLGFAAVGAVGRPTRGASAMFGQPLPRHVPVQPPVKLRQQASPAKSAASRTAPKARKRR
jgi:hypothetical protein